MRVLVLHPGSLGDFLLAVPALRSLRTRFLQDNIHWVAQPSLLHLFSEIGLYDTCTSIDTAGISLLFSEAVLLKDFPIRNLDTAVCWIKDPEGSVSKNLERLGADPVVIRNILSDCSDRHRSDLFMESLRPFGIESAEEPNHFLPQKWRTVGETILKRWKIPPPIVLHPGGGGLKKRWPPALFAQLGDRMVEYGFPVVLLEGPAEPGLAYEVSKEMALPSKVASGIDLKSVAGLLSVSKGFIGNDSGVTHLAAALALPTLVLFKGSDPLLWGPRGMKVWIKTDLASINKTLENFLTAVDEPTV